MSIKEKVNFNIIRYANCWEDPEILLEGLKPQEGSKILSIGSAGDNSFSLLVSNPKLVVAIDINTTQLHLIELKKAAIAYLEHDDFIRFIGFVPSNNRLNLFNKIKIYLPEISRKHWENNLQKIELGIIHQGKFENYFNFFNRRILPLIHSKKTINELFESKSISEQTEFLNKKWNNVRWRLLFKVFFSRFILGKFGRDPQFLNEVEINVSNYLLTKSNDYLSSNLAQNNHFLRYIMLGNFGSILPHYAQKDNFEIIKKNINNLVTYEGFAQDASNKFGKFNCMNLSNIFEYMNLEVFNSVACNLIDIAETDCKIAYWNLMVNRKISSVFPDKLSYLTISEELSRKDKGFFYKHFIVEQIK